MISPTEVLLQQIITGLSNGMIIALIALGYTMVYGIIELINFAHGDLFMLGSFFALTMVGALGLEHMTPGAGLYAGLFGVFLASAIFAGGLNWTIDRLAYKPLRNAPKLSPLVSAIGVSFILMNLGLFWGAAPMGVFNEGRAAAAPKNFPGLLPNTNLLGEGARLRFTAYDLLVYAAAVPSMIALTAFVKKTRMGRAMRAVAQNPTAARLMGIDSDRVIGATFMIGGALAGAASVIYALYNQTIHFQMGFRVGMDAFTAAVLGGIGSLPGAMLGGLLIGLVRSLSDQYIATKWTNVMVFAILALILIFRPSGLLGSRLREKV